MNTTPPPQRGPRALWQGAPRAAEVAVGVILVAAAGADLVGRAMAGSPWLSWIPPLVVLAGVAVGFRSPAPGLAVVAVAPILAAAIGEEPIATWSMVCFAAFLFALRSVPGFVVGALLGAVNFGSVYYSIGVIDVRVDASASVFAFAAIVGAATGSAVRSNIRYRREVEQRIRESEVARLAAVDRGIAQERLRIARDLHDSVGHQIAVVNMHLGAAEVHAANDGAGAQASLAAARGAVQEVLRETQQILAVLGVERAAPGLGAAPSHELIHQLVETYRTAGMQVQESVQDLGCEIPSQVSIAAYRIVQEALTNAHRYGDGQASLTVTRDDQDGDVVRIEVANAYGVRTGSASPGGGNGLVGMRERAQSVGGRVEIRSDGPLFWLSATLPVGGGAT
ncbi:sensor histidine kinase [Promicromonospora sp. NFX87]|uniref:sensor histidine kinase n=1 Tax=Promicromonospora sp. NFX87 TaxID=3402691 RepID=UPI003AFAF39F